MTCDSQRSEFILNNPVQQRVDARLGLGTGDMVRPNPLEKPVVPGRQRQSRCDDKLQRTRAHRGCSARCQVALPGGSTPWALF